MTALARLTAVELKLFLRDPAAAFFTLLLPLLLLVLNSSPGVEEQSRLPSLCVLVLATGGLMWLPGTIALYRDQGILRRQQLAPVGAGSILGSHLGLQLVVAAGGILLLVGAGTAAAGYEAPVDPLGALAGLLLATLSVCALGFGLASVARTARATQAIASALYFPAIFLSGATWPREALPPLAEAVGAALPLTYAVDVVTQPWVDGGLPLGASLVCLAVIAIATPVAVLTFRWR